MAKKNEDITRARRNIQNAIDLAEEEHRRQLLRKRIELATHGVRAYRTRKLGDAVRSFHTYLKILEDWKGVGDGGLLPSHFDQKTDMAEMLLIAGIYWDLVKLYDRTKSLDKYRYFQMYLEKYELFSKGMPYQSLCTEMLRRYITHDKPVHRQDFRDAYTRMSGGKTCFVATALSDVTDSRTLPRLRAFRDGPMSRSIVGRAFTQWYYRRGAFLAELTDHMPKFVRITLGRTLDVVASIVAK